MPNSLLLLINMHEDIFEKIEIPEGIEVTLDKSLKIKGPKGEVEREFQIEIIKDGQNIIIEKKNGTKKDKKMIKTTAAHVKNMIFGVKEGYEYLLQVCSVHFPITVTATKDFLNIKNFLGETRERKSKILPNTQVKIEGDIIKITSPDKEAAGQTAANLETATKIKNRDRTRFQDGIWIIQKANKEI